MPKILTFPKPRKWKLPSIGLIPGGEDLRLVLAFDLPVVLVRQILEVQKVLQPKAESLHWLEARDFILPLIEIPNARSEAVEAVDARMRASVHEGFRGRFRAHGVFAASEGEIRVWVQVDDSELLWLRLRDWLANVLTKDGFEVVKPSTPKITLAEPKLEDPTALDATAYSSKDLGAFHVFDLVLYGRHRGNADPLYSAISFASLDSQKPL
jgi:2'-5' RNA ligase